MQLTLDATNLFSQEFIGNWLFNYLGDPVADNLDIPAITSSVIFAKSSTPTKDGGTQVKAGLFNLELIFDTTNNPNPPNPSDRFQGGETLTLTLTGTGITEGKFLGLSIDKPAARSIYRWLVLGSRHSRNSRRRPHDERFDRSQARCRGSRAIDRGAVVADGYRGDWRWLVEKTQPLIFWTLCS